MENARLEDGKGDERSTLGWILEIHVMKIEGG
jgi:hypothetical protein